MRIDLYICRHGQSLANVSGERIYDPPLTEEGRRQAGRLADALGPAGLTLVVASPLLRALETAAPVAAAAGVPLQAWSELAEFNEWDAYVGAAPADLRRRFPGVLLEADMPAGGHPYPGPEAATDGRARAGRLAARLAALPADTVAIVAHGAINSLLLGALAGVPADGRVTFVQENACISHVTLAPEGAILWRVNDTAHLH